MLTNQVKSKQRVKDHGEVFTPDFIVNDMLDLVKNETERVESRFLEPACGDGNFLAPVVEKESEVLSMTAPVVETGDNKKRIISFVMPFEYTLETLPKPNNPQVKIVPQKARKVAVLRFSWFRNTLRVAGKKQELFKLLERDSIKPKGLPEYAGYNAPFTAPWLNRNEVMVEIE